MKKSFYKQMRIVALLTAVMPMAAAAQETVTMVAGDNPEVVAPAGEVGVMIYDDGGAEGNAARRFKGTMVIAPATEDGKARVAFEKVSLTTKDTLYVYNGEGVEGEALAAIVGTTTTSSVVEDLTSVRSTADNGKLTLRFVTNAPMYQAEGFELRATTWRDPHFWKIDVNQTPYTAPVGPGTSKANLLDVEVWPDSVGIEQGLLGIDVVLKEGAVKNLSKIYLVDNDGNTLASATVTEGQSDYTLRAKSAFICNNWCVWTKGDAHYGELTALQTGTGENFFRVQGDVKSDATPNDTIDLCVPQAYITLDSVEYKYEIVPTVIGTEYFGGMREYVICGPDPDGSRLIMKTMNMNKNVHEITVPTDEQFFFYDSGGPGGNVPFDFDSYVTFIPEEEGKAIQLDVQWVSIYKDDFLVIYNGSEMTVENQLYVLTGTQDFSASQLFIPPFSSGSADGCLTLSMTQGGWFQPAGFRILVSVVENTNVGTGIDKQPTTPIADKQERYGLDGRQLTAPQKGLNIIRMSDGSVRKVMVK
ncbi:MAG: hypothetical protein IJV45_00400 [Prevotella sp.]|nr:hypothetical protein [Prevotella sp.]